MEKNNTFICCHVFNKSLVKTCDWHFDWLYLTSSQMGQLTYWPIKNKLGVQKVANKKCHHRPSQKYR